jgi:hypothetical protein
VLARQRLKDIIKDTGANIEVVEMPPGPPVLQSVVAEVHGPDAGTRREFAADLTGIFAEAESLRDVDNYMREPYQYWRFVVDTEKAVRRGISVDTINRNLSMALGGMPLGDVKQQAGHEPINISIQVPLAERSEITRLGDLPIMSDQGQTLPLRELGRFEQTWVEPIIYHKDLRPVEYVTADVGGRLAAPVYGMFQVQDLLAEKDYVAPDGTKVAEGGGFDDGFYWLGPPPDDSRSSLEWTGEWTVTFETFRDMGAAFMAALVLIYILVVWEFGNFRIPALIMAPIPLTLLGIIPIHAIFFQAGAGGEFTATSMIGWIALAGIIVRNSILLVDFSIHEVQRGTPVAEAVIRACKTRTRPIMITALALVAGSSVIFFDPIFQGMAISLASGVMVSTILTLVVIPLGCIKASRSLCEVAAAGCPPGTVIPELEDFKAGSAAKAKTAKPAKQRKPYKTPLWMKVWSLVANVLMMIFYAVRGIGLLLAQAFKRKPKRPPPQTPAGPSAGGGSGGGSGGGGGTTPPPSAPGGAVPGLGALRPQAGGTRAGAKAEVRTVDDEPARPLDLDEPPPPAKAEPESKPVERGGGPAAAQASSGGEATLSEGAKGRAVATGAQERERRAAAFKEPRSAAEEGTAAPVATDEEPSAPARKKAAKRAVTKKAAPKKAAAAKVGVKKAAAAKVGSKKAGAQPSEAGQSGARQAQAGRSGGVAGDANNGSSEGAQAAAKKRAARRGIRLKGVEPPSD